jgi:regulator of protease activity HflC (stomatin/prohibitin superfamily)
LLPLCAVAALVPAVFGLLPASLENQLLPLRLSGLLMMNISAVLLPSAALAASWIVVRCAARAGALLPCAILLAGAALAIIAAAACVLDGGLVHGVPPATCMALGSVMVAFGFPLLIAERMVAFTLPSMLPRQSALHRLTVLPLACLMASAAACVAEAAGVSAMHAAAMLCAGFLALAGTELFVRAAFGLFGGGRHMLPVSLLLLRPFDPRFVRPGLWSAELRARFGVDFARSWALRYASNAFWPICLVLAALCVVLTGLVRIDTTERGIYQRLGRPVAVLKPGLHLLLPWPLGQVRRVENGVIHSVPISFGDEAEASPDAVLVAALTKATPSTAEGPPPIDSNRLWEASQPSDVTFLIASDEGAQGPHEHGSGFELISVSMRVLYRIGLDPHAALSAAYASADPATLVRMGASQLLARHLAMRTLRQVLVEDRAGMSRSLGADLQEMLSRLNTGIEVLSVIVEAAHPPGGAAAAYRQVQAAEIAAQTEISLERGRAETTAGLAARDAADVLASATAGAAERVARAQAQRTAMLADEFAHHASPGAFALERRLSALQAALGAGEADILDPRLEPTLDLRQAEQGK